MPVASSWGTTRVWGRALHRSNPSSSRRTQAIPVIGPTSSQPPTKGGTMLSLISQFRRPTRVLVALTITLLFAFSSTILAFAKVNLIQLSSDPYTNSTSQHKTEVEPDTFAFGSTIVSAFQVGRFFNGGASNIGFATSTNGGSSFTSGFLPSGTGFATLPGIYPRANDPPLP